MEYCANENVTPIYKCSLITNCLLFGGYDSAGGEEVDGGGVQGTLGEGTGN